MWLLSKRVYLGVNVIQREKIIPLWVAPISIWSNPCPATDSGRGLFCTFNRCSVFSSGLLSFLSCVWFQVQAIHSLMFHRTSFDMPFVCFIVLAPDIIGGLNGTHTFTSTRTGTSTTSTSTSSWNRYKYSSLTFWLQKHDWHSFMFCLWKLDVGFP